MINRKRLLGLTKELIGIDSQNPPGCEAKIAKYVKDIMLKAGLASLKTYTFSKGRPNVIGILKAKSSKGALLLSPHMDTVPAGRGWRHNPFRAVIKEGKLFGRGATDCKGNLAVCLELLQSLDPY